VKRPSTTDTGTRDRAEYVSRAAAANDSQGAVAVLTATQLATIVRNAVAEAFAERESAEAPVPLLLDRDGIAAALGCSVSQVDKLRQRGMPNVWLGDSPRFEREACINWVRGQKGRTS
jgi:hypothetical protein